MKLDRFFDGMVKAVVIGLVLYFSIFVIAAEYLP
jgi:hypothetical protein